MSEDAEEPVEGELVEAGAARPVHMCHHGCDCWQINFDRYVTGTPARAPGQLDNVESQALLDAKNRATRLVRQHEERMASERRRVITSDEDARAALAVLRSVAEGGEVGRAVQDRRRLREERVTAGVPQRPLWVRVIVWPTIIAVGAFDTWYFQSIFQRFVGNTDVSWREQVITFAPGLALTVGIVVGGALLGGPVSRAARLHGARQRKRAGFRRAAAAILHWAMRLALPLLLIVLIGGWALYRVQDVNDGPLSRPLPPDLITILMVTLTLSAMALKIVAYDPYAAREAEVKRRGRLLRARAALRLRRAGAAVRRHALAHSDLSALRDDLVSRVSEQYGAAYQFMLFARGFHDQAGPLPPDFADGTRGSGLRDRIRPELAGITGPEPEFGALLQVQEVLERHPALRSREELDRLAELLAGQRAAR
ncbi:hypothetical protein [Nonomuraea typhae]|uniref:DUF4129 domain-containing protein n=1 Tax=Nonomuraea typhae TaxID=2603600 RepID=A0ABW7YLF8_9ACTN